MSGPAYTRLEAALVERGFGPIRGGMARCPAHDDRTPSLSVKPGPKGVLVRCHAGCTTDDVVRALDLELGELFDRPNGNGQTGPAHHVVATYVYTDEQDRPLFEVRRLEPKGFLQARIEPDGRRVSGPGCMKDVLRVPYRLPEVLAAVAAGDPVWVCEGEKDADRLRAEGWPATCNPAGAGKWRPEFGEHFRDAADVRVIADRDLGGYRHAAQVSENLHAHGATVRVFETAHGKDVSDHLDAGGALEDLVEIDLAARATEFQGDSEEGQEETAARWIDLDRVAFSGARLLALLERETPLPVEAARPVPGHFSTLIAPPMVGKSALAFWNAMARAAGVAPWPGVEARPAGRVLIYSIDEAPEQVVRRMNGLSLFHPAGRLEGYAERLVIVGPDRDLDAAALDTLRFDEAGLATLERFLAEAAAAGAPFTEVYVDAYADVIPLGESENSNEEATRIGGALERLAVRYGCAIVLLHHVGKPKPDAGEVLPDVRYMGRGASALGAKARSVTSLEVVSGMPNLRRVRTATNLGRTPRPMMFEVCAAETAAEELIYFKPAADPGARDPRELLQPGETITTGELARRLAGDSLAEGSDPPGDLKRMATTLREGWRVAGKVIVADGPRRSKTLTLVEAEAISA